MIRNIVFDIGDVLVGYSLKKELERFGTNLNRIGEANNLITKDDNWKKY